MKLEKSCGAVLFTIGGKRCYVLVRSANKRHWGLPKGHVEAGETEQETALREVIEETGIKASLTEGFRKQIEYDMPNGARKQVVFFVAKYDGATQEFVLNPSEVSDIVAVPLDEALKMITHDAVRQVLLEADCWISREGGE